MRAEKRPQKIDVETAPPVNILDERGNDRNRHRMAVIVCHGMGQQVRFQTIGDLVNTLARTSGVSGPVAGRLVRFANGLTLGRAEVTFRDGNGDTHGADVYEAYWAPLTEGRVTLSDVLLFLFRAGWDGAWAAARGKFHRFMFNQTEAFSSSRWTFLAFLVALAVVGSLVAVNFGAAAIVAGRFGVPKFGWATAPWFSHAVAADILVLGLGLVLFTIPFVIPRTTSKIAQICDRRRNGLGTLLSTFAIYALFFATIVAGGLTTLHVALAVAKWEPVWDGLFWSDHLLTWIEGRGIVGLWGAVLLLSAGVRWFLVNFGGDVTAYVSAHRLSKFDEIRDAIKKTTFEAVCAVYREGGYRQCVLVGHSLGAVAAYDALNAILVEQAITGATFAPTAGFVTFGAPLDKTAFVFRTHNPMDCDVREALAAAVQPLISFEQVRPRWVNIWSPNDIISGSLELYDREDRSNRNPVTNLIDWQADKPLYAHLQYWNNDLLSNVIGELCIGSQRLFDREVTISHESSV